MCVTVQFEKDLKAMIEMILTETTKEDCLKDNFNKEIEDGGQEDGSIGNVRN